MKNKKIISLLTIFFCITTISSCINNSIRENDVAPQSTPVSEQKTSSEAKNIIETKTFQKEDYIIKFEHCYSSEETSKEYAVITVSKNNTLIWSYETEKMTVTELDRVEFIESPKDKIYINVGGNIIALDLETGEQLWKNNNSSGASTCSVIDENDTLYIMGYYGPHLHVIDNNGNTIKMIESFDDNLYWPYEAKLSDDILTIKYASDDNASIEVDLNDYSYKINNH